MGRAASHAGNLHTMPTAGALVQFSERQNRGSSVLLPRIQYCVFVFRSRMGCLKFVGDMIL